MPLKGPGSNFRKIITLAAYVQEKLNNTNKERYIYISHEHKDHFDLKFLNSIENRDFTLIIAKFRRAELRRIFKDYNCKKVISCSHGEEVLIADGTIKLYLIDTELNRDSAILLKTNIGSFLNINDCKLMDMLPEIIRERRKSRCIYLPIFRGNLASNLL